MSQQTLQDDIRDWHRTAYPDADFLRVALKLTEEAGEVAGAVLKFEEGRRNESDIEDEIGDVGIVLMRLASLYGRDLIDLIGLRFEEVRLR